MTNLAQTHLLANLFTEFPLNSKDKTPGSFQVFSRSNHNFSRRFHTTLNENYFFCESKKLKVFLFTNNNLPPPSHKIQMFHPKSSEFTIFRHFIKIPCIFPTRKSFFHFSQFPGSGGNPNLANYSSQHFILIQIQISFSTIFLSLFWYFPIFYIIFLVNYDPITIISSHFFIYLCLYT